MFLNNFCIKVVSKEVYIKLEKYTKVGQPVTGLKAWRRLCMHFESSCICNTTLQKYFLIGIKSLHVIHCYMLHF